MTDSVRAVAFDLDDTLAVSKSRIDDRMAELLARLLGAVDVCIISGGRFEQFDSQVLQHLNADADALASLHLMPTCGTRYYRWGGDGWQLVYAEDLAEPDKRRIIAVLEQGAKELGFWTETAWGERIEDRGSQITYSALGQQAPPAAKYEWDPDNSKKQQLRAYAAERLPDLEVRVGGSTSVDVTRKGIDKAYGMRKLMAQLGLAADEILFVGDRLEPGGNDYPVRAVGVRWVEVGRWQDTADYVERILARAAESGDSSRLEVPARL
ncbi:MAG: HAD-IIB family hydrolase [Actinobacteria bacterium]|nr:HAD-IIB family hydrolase [Actinomycetota bacterium]MBO0833506.1 HAD-IIB family hydrolase [Actinomycetota bacterium]MBO0837784.1 HAD-IIB family hydrolase [Actinomycetota bacterium]